MADIIHRPRYQTVDGIRFPEMFSPKCFLEAKNYKPTADDVFILTYPKCGTTWMQNIVLYIYRKGKELDNISDFIHMCPFIDIVGKEGIEMMPKPGAFKTHIPYMKGPYSPEAKYIVVLRNPKDCCVSLYYHTKTTAGFGYWDAGFDEFFEIFMAGEVEYNDYFDHMMSWYQHRDNKRLLFTTYEDLKRDASAVVTKVATFLGKEYIEAIEKDNSVLHNILRFSHFDYMKKNISQLYELKDSKDTILANPNVPEGIRYMIKFTLSMNSPSDMPKLEFVRKGVIGDWRNHFSQEQSERLNKKFFERTKGTEIEDMYRCYM